jgi:hypothetical protein
MSRFRFAVSNWEGRQEGVVESDSFDTAVSSLGKHVSVKQGDTLEIGVAGFPPAHFECVGSVFDGQPLWMPSVRQAA